MIVRQPICEHPAPPQVSLLTAEQVRALARLEAGGHVLDPPCSPAQPLQRFDRFARRDLLLEDLPRLVPCPTGERVFTLSDALGHGRHLGHERTVSAGWFCDRSLASRV